MILIPAIDLKDGHCVRLRQGDMNQATVFSENPAEMALHWLKQGARRLHLVDLNGAFAGKPVNEDAIKSILKTVKQYAKDTNTNPVPVQLGGGIRDIATAKRILDYGISYIIIGTAAVTNPLFLEEACKQFPGQIMVGLDAKDGKVAIDGWASVTDFTAAELAQRYQYLGVVAIIYTDIGRDGMMKGINDVASATLARQITIPVYASGGLHNLDDIKRLCAVAKDGVAGVICGRSIYEGTLDLKEGQATADQLLNA